MSMDHKTRLSPGPRPTDWQTGDLVRSRKTRNIKHIWNVIIVLMFFIGSPESQFSRTIESGRVGLLSDLSSGSVLMCTVGGEAGAGL